MIKIPRRFPATIAIVSGLIRRGACSLILVNRSRCSIRRWKPSGDLDHRGIRAEARHGIERIGLRNEGERAEKRHRVSKSVEVV